MTFYKGNDFETKEKILIDDYMKGVHINYRKNLKTKLTNELNSYNEKLKKEANGIIKKYENLIRVEFVLSKILKTFLQNDVYFSVHNVVNVQMKAQVGTILVYKNYIEKFDKYRIAYMDTYEAFCKVMKSNNERYERNANMINRWMEDFGFGSLLNCIEKNFQMNFFTFVLNFENDFYIKNMFDFDLKNKESRYTYNEKLAENFCEYFLNIAKENNISLEREVVNSCNILYSKNKETKEEIRERNKLYKKHIFESMAKEITMEDNIELYNIIFGNGIAKKERSDLDYLRENLRQDLYECECDIIYVVASTKSNVYYVTEDMKLSKSFKKAKRFEVKDEKELNDFIFKVKELYPTRYVEHSRLKNSFNKKKAI